MDKFIRRARTRVRSSRAPRTRSVVIATALVVVCLSPFAVAKTGNVLREGKRNGTATKETLIVSKNNATSGATGGYATRQSNLSSTGGGAIYGCRASAAATSNPCMRANNLSSGRAFEFNAQNGDVAGTIIVGAGGATKKPFTTNATGVATGLNADQVDGKEAADLGGPKAYARVDSTAATDTVDPNRSKGITNANVSDFGTGGTCISGLPFTPKTAVATIANFSAGQINADVAPDVGACPAGTQARVQTYNSAGAATDGIDFIIHLDG